MTRCIFCREDRPASDEHIFPRAIGGNLTTGRVCDTCNSTLGAGADSALTNNKFVRVRRGELGLAGNSGIVPDPVAEMLKLGELSDQPGVRVRVATDPTTGRPDPRILRSVVVKPDGSQAMIIDARDANQIGVRLQRERRAAGLPPLSAEEIAGVVAQARASARRIDRPWVKYELQIPIDDYLPGLAKIAYELAFWWFGEAYLDDPSATHLRTAILANDLTAAPIEVNTSIEDALRFWREDRNSHIAFTSVLGTKIMIAVRVFDVLSAAFVVSESASAYISNDSGDDRFRFLALDPVTKIRRETPFWVEASRLMSGSAPGPEAHPTTENG